jgi:hypothetical protein
MRLIVQREDARRLLALGGTMPDANAAPRRRPAPALATAKRRAVPPQSDPHRYIGLNRSLQDDRRRLAALEQVVEQNAELIKRALHEHFAQVCAVRRQQHLGRTGRWPRDCSSNGLVPADYASGARAAHAAKTESTRSALSRLSLNYFMVQETFLGRTRSCPNTYRANCLFLSDS